MRGPDTAAHTRCTAIKSAFSASQRIALDSPASLLSREPFVSPLIFIPFSLALSLSLFLSSCVYFLGFIFHQGSTNDRCRGRERESEHFEAGRGENFGNRAAVNSREKKMGKLARCPSKFSPCARGESATC